MPEALTEQQLQQHHHSLHTSIYSGNSAYGTGGTFFEDNDSAFSSESGGLSGGTQEHQTPHYGAQGHASNGNRGTDLEVVPRRTLYVKIFCGDGSTKSVMINETMSIAYVLSILVEKNHVQPDPSWGIVEQIPELYLERCFEDHECLVENLLDWRADSPNKILFLSRPEKYDLFRRPERYLVSSPSYGSGEPSQVKSGCTGGSKDLGGGLGGAGAPIGSSLNTTWDQLSRQNLLQEFFSRSGEDYYPEIEGMLWLKTEGKKSWKKNYFALRADGIYQRGGKLLASICDHQVYKAIGWKKKYKAPNDFGFALKHPQVQVKDEGKYIKYLCAESESALLKWLTGLRIVKNKDYLLDNYQNQLAEMTTGHCIARENRVVIAIHKEEPPANPPPPARRSVHPPRLASSQPGNEMVYSPSSTTSSSNSSEREHMAGQMSSNELLLQKTQISCESLSSSGCESLSENAGFEVDYHNGGTIRRKPGLSSGGVKATPPRVPQAPIYASDPPTPLAASEEEEEDEEEFVLPPPPMPDLSISSSGRFEREDTMSRAKGASNGGLSHSSSTNSLPPPPPAVNEKQEVSYQVQYHTYGGQSATYSVRQAPQSIYNNNYPPPPPVEENGEIREELYPCGVARCLFPNRTGGGTPKKNQMDLLKRLPNQVPPPPAPNYCPPILKSRKKRITFNELVENFNMDTCESEMTPLKDNDPGFKVPSASVRNPNPGKLFGDNHAIKGTPPREFLNDLQRVMYRKWTLSQKIHFPGAETEEEEHFARENPGGFSNYNENAVSHWILQSLKHCQINEEEEESLHLGEEDLPPPPPSLLMHPPHAYPPGGAFPVVRSVPNTFPPRPEDRPFLLCQMRSSGLHPNAPQGNPTANRNNNLYYGPNSYSGPKMH